MARNKIIKYNPILKQRARYLRNNSTFSEIILWKRIKKRALGFEFHRQVPINSFIVDFYCHELMLAIEVDGYSHNNKVEYDLMRQQKLENLGVRFIRFANSEVKRDINAVINSLEKKIEEIKMLL